MNGIDRRDTLGGLGNRQPVDRQLADGREELDGLPTKTSREGHIPAGGAASHGRHRDIPHTDRAHRLKRRLNLPGRGVPGNRAGGPAGKAKRERAAIDRCRQHHPLHGADARDACRGIAYRHAGDCQNARHEGVDRPASEAADEGHIPAVGRANDRLDADIPGADRTKGLECRLDVGGRGTGGDQGACLAAGGDGEGPRSRPRHPLHGAASDRTDRRVGYRGSGRVSARVGQRRRDRGRGPEQGHRPPSEATDEGHIPAGGRAGNRLDAHIAQPNGRQRSESRLDGDRRGVPRDLWGRLAAVGERELAPRGTAKRERLHRVDRPQAGRRLADRQSDARQLRHECHGLDRLESEAPGEGHLPLAAGARHCGDRDIPRADCAQGLERRLNIPGRRVPGDRRGCGAAVAELEPAPQRRRRRRQRHPLHGVANRGACGGGGDKAREAR